MTTLRSPKKMSPEKIIPEKLNSEQLRKIKNLLKIPKDITNSDFLNNVDYTIDKFEGSTLVNIHYKQYVDNIDSYWKQFRGIIIKDFEKIIADSNGHTPLLTLTQKLPDSGKLKLKEYQKDGTYIEHTLDFTPGSCHLRPAFQGTIVRLSLVDGKVLRSTLRRINMKDSKWPNADETITFEQKFDLLCQYGKELFTPGKLNSPFCHVFLMCVPQSLTFSHVDCGEGFVMYLQSFKSYTPDDEDEDEEQESYLNHKIDESELTEDEKQAGVKIIKDRYFFPLSENKTKNDKFSEFIPPPSTLDLLRQYAAVYWSDTSMSINEANLFLSKGVSKIESIKLAEMSRISPLLLPGEGIFYTGYNKKGQKMSNYIILPECCNYRSVINNDPNNAVRQLTLLRQVNDTNVTISTFHNHITVDNLSFQNITFPINDNNYPFFESLTKELDIINFNFNNLPSNVDVIDIDKNEININSRFRILGFFYVLANPTLRRKIAYHSISKTEDRINQTYHYIIQNQVALSDPQSDFYKKKPLTYEKYFDSSQRIRDIISAASVKNGVVSSVAKTTNTSFPQKKISGPKPSSIPKKDDDSYAQVVIKKSKEKDQNKINSKIIQFLDEENGAVLYKITSLIRLLIENLEE